MVSKKNDVVKKVIATTVMAEFKEWISEVAKAEGRTFCGQVSWLLSEARGAREQKTKK